MWKTGDLYASKMAIRKRVRTPIQNIAIQFAFSCMEDKHGQYRHTNEYSFKAISSAWFSEMEKLVVCEFVTKESPYLRF